MLADLTYRNLDDEPALAGMNTTTEELARVIADRLADACTPAPSAGAPEISTASMITLHESHIAWASYERPL